MKAPLSVALNLLLAVAIWALPMHAQAAEESIAGFDLPRWGSDETLSLSAFTGEIVVLDFFAYWCVPCRKASVEIEGGIARYYASRHGNPQGVPVRVISVNIEQAKPEQTERFIADAGLERVVNDVGAKLLEELGGEGTPFVVVIDATHATREEPDYRIVYRSSGFKGTKPIRTVIDSIKPPPQAAEAEDAGGIIEKPSGPPVTRQADLAFEAMLSSDIDVTSTAITYGQTHGGTQWKLNYTHNTYVEDYEPYEPFDFLGYPERLREHYDGGAGSVRQALGRGMTWLVGAGGYTGFTDYRSVWLANYYKQQFSFVPGYEDPDPYGYNASTSLRWEYLPATAFVEASFLYAYDQIAPGYEFDPFAGVLVHDNDQLDTWAPALRFENIVGRRIRLLNEVQLTSTTGRQNRYAYRGAVNVALGERWVWRTVGGYTWEDPALRACYAGTTLEFELANHWLLNASGLYYEDTGEIENSTFLSTAAPGLKTWQAGLGLRYVGRVSTVSLSVAPIFADYAPVGVGTRPFTNLYQDRTWLSIQAAWTMIF